MKIELAEFCNKIEVYDQIVKNRNNADIYLLDIMQKYADEQCAIHLVSQQRELLLAFAGQMQSIDVIRPEKDVEKHVDNFLANNCG